MSLDLAIGVYDPCPCGSGAKYKFCCAARNSDLRHGRYPLATVACYGPDNKTTTKIVASIFLNDLAIDPLMEKFFGDNVASDPAVRDQIRKFFASNGVKQIVASDRNIGCPHEEGPDFPLGQDCPLCPFWAGKQGTASTDRFARFLPDELETQEAPNLDPLLEDPQADAQDNAVYEAVARIYAILGDDVRDPKKTAEKLVAHLRANLQLPCKVTGLDAFAWEDRFHYNRQQYKKLKKTNPCGSHHYELMSISADGSSQWLAFEEDIRARCRRISDDKIFTLGLSELVALDRQSPNRRLLSDYATWFFETRDGFMPIFPPCPEVGF